MSERASELLKESYIRLRDYARKSREGAALESEAFDDLAESKRLEEEAHERGGRETGE